MRYRAWGTLLASMAGLLLMLDMPDRIAADLMGDIQQGLKTTGKLFGINTIADVADLVAKGFATRRGSQDEVPQRPTQASESVGVADALLTQAPSMMTIMMKLLGLDGSQLGAMLVNGIVFLAHIIGTNLGAFRSPTLDTSSSFPSTFPSDPPLTGESQSAEASGSQKPGSNPLEWLLRNPSKRFRVLLDQVQNTDLAERLDREMDQLDRYAPEDTDCIRLLMCKVKPFIWKMQNVVRNQILAKSDGQQQQPTGNNASNQSTSVPNGEEILKGIHENLPSEKEFLRQSKLCEQQFRHCRRLPE
ncbi:uncharacterized protein LOC126562713 [Anopheles maculipalpis]|uniref:uncharacterized protein LOC126562713 n=1 Tax=Anopheles maculipalpis TaxID=1496333 RepID=UPI002158A6B3|nr:uncharacterized protein LOC126562713 [Anopheles maculipalpis]